MTYIPPANGGRINATIGGNTAGAGALVSTGTLTLAGGNNITLSQNGNAITISGGAGGAGGSNTLGISNLGNSVGTSGVINGSALQLAFAGGNNVTLSQSINASSGTITISAANQTVQTQNLHNVTLSGNTAGAMAHISSGTLTLAGGNNITLSQNANAITISGGGLSNINFSAGTTSNNLSNAVFSNANGVSFGLNGSTLTASVDAAAGGNITLSQYQNMDRGTSATFAFPYNSVFFQRLNQENDLFAGNMTVSTAMLNISGSVSSGASSTQTLAAHTLSVSLGLYQPVASANTVLTLINSASTSFGSNNTMSVYPYYYGNRWVSLHSSQWSSSPAFSQGKDYVFGVLVRSAGTSTGLSFIGQNYMNSNQRSGFFGVSSTAGNQSTPHGNFWNAIYSVTSAALPTVVSGGEVNRNAALAVFIPHIVFNNQYAF